MYRFFAKPTGSVIRLSDEDAAHIRSLRLRPSELFIVCDGDGRDYICNLAESQSFSGSSEKHSETYAEIVGDKPTSGEPALSCTAFIALAKGDRLDYAVQKSVELGARAIVLFQSQRCIASSGNIVKKTERLQRIALEAAKQCGRGRVPDVTMADSYKDAIGQASQAELPLFFYESEEELTLREALESRADASTISIVTGPEGGFEEDEAAFARESGMLTVTLGPRVLRCETAPVAALAAIMYHTGNF